jgi:hypothetical protein
VTVEVLLSRLSKVRGRNGSWTACCPAHDDKSPSLAIKDDGGKVLVHCFGGCSVEAVLGAVGMDLTELFPPKPQEYRPQPKAKFYASDLLRVIAMEARIVAIGAYDMGKGKTLPATDLARLQLACQRINSALEATE